jgi:hypothetical protein
MNRKERELEKAVKRVLHGEPGAVESAAALWKELGPAGSRLVVRLLQRQDGWGAFARPAAAIAEGRRMLESLASFPGVGGAALAVLQQAGIDSPPPDAPSLRAIRIHEMAGGDQTADRDRAAGMMLSSDEMLEGVLSLIEAAPSSKAADFLTSALSGEVSAGQDQHIRKTLYRLKQQGVSVAPREQHGVAQTEWWAMAENREAQAQFAMCFRFHSSFSSTGDLYVLRILEGKKAYPLTQEPGLQMSRSRFEEFCRAYSSQLQQTVRAEINMIPLPAAHAHFFFRKSLSFLPGDNAGPLLDFLRFLGAAEGENPFPAAGASRDGQDSMLLEHPYFLRWFLEPEDLEEYFQQDRKLEEGPIILVGAPQLEQKRSVAEAGLRRYFDARRRLLWGFLFRKASYFLRNADPDGSASSLRVAERFEDETFPVDELIAARILFERTVELHEKMEEQKQKEAAETSLIMTPEQYSRSTQRKR